MGLLVSYSTIKEAHVAKKRRNWIENGTVYTFLCFFFTEQYSWAQVRIEFFLSVTRDINAIALNSSGFSLVHFLCTWISKYSLLPGKVRKLNRKKLWLLN
jgi:hypothetical protein